MPPITFAAALRSGGMRDDALRQIAARADRLEGNVYLVEPSSTVLAGTAMAADVFRC